MVVVNLLDYLSALMNMTKLLKFGIRSHVFHYIILSTIYLQVCNLLGSANTANKVCRTRDCISLANYYKRILDPKGDPCNDFYDYVCHGWSSMNPKPKDIEFWADHEIFKRAALLKVKELLDDKRDNGVEGEANAKSLYTACMNQPFEARVPPAVLKQKISEVGDWPMFIPERVMRAQHINWQHAEEKYISIAGESSLFGYQLTSYNENGFHIIPFLKYSKSPYGMLNRRTDWNDKKERRHYKAFLKKIVDAVAPLDTAKFQDTINQDLEDVITFRDNLRNLKNTAGSVETMKIADFQEYYENYGSSLPTAKFDWLKTIRSMHKNSKDSNGNPIERTSLIDVQIKYFTSLALILANTTSRVIGNHVHLYFAERHILLDKEMETELENTVTDPVFRFASIRHESERWQTCILNMNVGDTLGQMYVKSHFSKGDQLSVTGMVLDGISIVQKQISESKWANPLVIQNWKQKINQINTQIGYPRWYYDNSSTQMHQDIDPIEIVVSYWPRFNKIGLSAAYLQSPTYDPHLPFVIRYGSLLPSIGHELYHMLEYTDLDKNFGGLDVLTKQDMFGKLREQVLCFVDQYNDYKQKEIKKKKLKINYKLRDTTNEDIPDVMGLKVAYIGYKTRLSMENCTVLQGLEHIGCDQLFFIAYAKKYCSEFNHATAMRLLTTDPHSLPNIRVNGAVANMKEFAQAFNCRPGSALAPNKTCDLWQV